MTRSSLGYSVGLAFLLVGIYHLGLLPDLPALGDSAKFQLVGSKLGTPHSSGYPLWVMLCNLFYRLLPGVSPTYAANLLTALFSIGGSVLAFHCQRLLEVRPWPAAVMAITLALTPALWSHSIVAEVYSLHYLFVAATVYSLLRWLTEQNEWWLYMALGIFALSFSNHQSGLWLAPGIAGTIWWQDRQTKPGAITEKISWAPRETKGRPFSRWKWRLMALICGGMLAALTYTYIVWCTYAPLPSYLEMQAVDASELLFQVAGGPSRQHLFSFELRELLLQQLPRVIALLLNETWPWLFLALFGLLRRPGRKDLLLGLLALGVFSFVATFTVPDLQVHFIPLVFLLALYAGKGLDGLLTRWKPLQGGLGLAFCSLLVIAQAATSWDDLGVAHRSASSQKADQVMTAIGDQSALLISLDYNFSMAFQYRSHWGSPQQKEVLVQHTPAIALALPSAMLPLRRYLQQNQSFRLGSTGRLIPTDLPVFAYCPTALVPDCAKAFRRHEISTQEVAGGLFQLRASPRQQSPLPRVWMVSELESVPTLPEALDRLRAVGFDQFQQAIRLGPTQEISRRIPPTEPHRCVLLRNDPRLMEIEVEAKSTAWLVIADSFPSRWSASIDGQPVGRQELNLSWVGIPIPPGRHLVRFSDNADTFSWQEFFTG